MKKEEVPQDKEAQPVTEYKGDKSIEEILDFIEGNKAGNAKRTAKKMRKRQRQVSLAYQTGISVDKWIKFMLRRAVLKLIVKTKNTKFSSLIGPRLEEIIAPLNN